MKDFAQFWGPYRSSLKVEACQWLGRGEFEPACFKASPERISCASVSWFSWWEVFLSPTWWSSLPVSVSALSRVDLWTPNLQFFLLSTILSSLWGRKTMLWRLLPLHTGLRLESVILFGVNVVWTSEWPCETEFLRYYLAPSQCFKNFSCAQEPWIMIKRSFN